MLKTISRRRKRRRMMMTTTSLSKPQAAISGGLPTWGLSQGRNTNTHPFVGPAKGAKKSKAPHINTHSSPLSVLMLFFKEIFRVLVEKSNVYYQHHLDRQASPSHQLPDTLLDMKTFVCRWDTNWKTHYMTTSWDLNSYHSVLWWDHDMRHIFTHTTFSVFWRQFTETWWRRIWPTMETKDCLWQTEWGLF